MESSNQDLEVVKVDNDEDASIHEEQVRRQNKHLFLGTTYLLCKLNFLKKLLFLIHICRWRQCSSSDNNKLTVKTDTASKF